MSSPRKPGSGQYPLGVILGGVRARHVAGTHPATTRSRPVPPANPPAARYQGAIILYTRAAVPL